MSMAVELRAGTLLAGSALLAAFVLSELGVAEVGAQSSNKSDTTRFVIVVRPHVGDTLWLHLEQTMETRSSPVSETRAAITPTPRPSGTAVPEYGPLLNQGTVQSTYMRLNAHSTVEFSDLNTTALNVITDSLRVRVGNGSALGRERPVVIPASERRTRVNVTPNGAMSVVSAGPSTSSLAAGLAGMPPMLPSRPVAVGEQWEREVNLPSLPLTSVRTDGTVHAQFRLDSLGRGGKLAYISLTGTLRREGAARELPPGTQVATSGVLRGYLIVDRARGWITEAETVIEVTSEVTPRVGDSAKARTLDIRLLQRMRVR